MLVENYNIIMCEVLMIMKTKFSIESGSNSSQHPYIYIEILKCEGHKTNNVDHHGFKVPITSYENRTLEVRKTKKPKTHNRLRGFPWKCG